MRSCSPASRNARSRLVEPACQAKPDDLGASRSSPRLATADAGSPTQAEAPLARQRRRTPARAGAARRSHPRHQAARSRCWSRSCARTATTSPRSTSPVTCSPIPPAARRRRARTCRPRASSSPAILRSSTAGAGCCCSAAARRGAIRALDHASRFAPREPEILLHLATAWAADTCPKTAAELLARAVAFHPTRRGSEADQMTCEATLVIR